MKGTAQGDMIQRALVLCLADYIVMALVVAITINAVYKFLTAEQQVHKHVLYKLSGTELSLLFLNRQIPGVLLRFNETRINNEKSSSSCGSQWGIVNVSLSLARWLLAETICNDLMAKYWFWLQTVEYSLRLQLMRTNKKNSHVSLSRLFFFFFFFSQSDTYKCSDTSCDRKVECLQLQELVLSKNGLFENNFNCVNEIFNFHEKI